MPSNDTVEILFFGDIVGKPGRHAVAKWLSENPPGYGPTKPGLVIANIENATHGFGFSMKHYDDMRTTGIHVFTSGNHIVDRPDYRELLTTHKDVLRPDNYPDMVPGRGAYLYQIPGTELKIGVINLLGQVFMGQYNSPWECLERRVAELKKETPILFLDFHAETTAEKMAMGLWAADMGVSAMTGTHTHVQTNDAQIMKGRMGYITDAGMNGPRNSVIGMRPESSIARMRSHQHARLEVLETDDVQINAVRFVVQSNGSTISTEPIHEKLILT